MADKSAAQMKVTSTYLNTLAKEVHDNAVKHGWWEKEKFFPEIMALVHSEVSEALEEYRKGSAPVSIYYDKNSDEPDSPQGIPIELADAIIRILDYCAYAHIDIDRALLLKHEYNKTRSYRHGGKKC